MTSARIIADSIRQSGDRLTSFVVTFPRYILAEFNTHRMLSRNSASSRARPHHVMLKEVMKNPFIPIQWMKEHRGMQGSEYFSDDLTIAELKAKWLSARDAAVNASQQFDRIDVGLTKQLSNRLLEPFLWQTVIVSATEWENFFALRAHEAADIHIQDLAHQMLIEYNKSNPQMLKAGQWHIPFGDLIDLVRVNPIVENPEDPDLIEMALIKIASARCARISYSPFGEESKYDYLKDFDLHDRLASMGHWSAFEHCARAMTDEEYDSCVRGSIEMKPNEKGWCGNFKGFIQYRKLFENENRNDPRVRPKPLLHRQ